MLAVAMDATDADRWHLWELFQGDEPFGMEFAQSSYPHIQATAVRHFPMLLEFVIEDLQDDWDLVHEAVQKNGLALQFASDRLIHDRWLIRRAIEQNPEALFLLLGNERWDPVNVFRALILGPHIRASIPRDVLDECALQAPDLYTEILNGGEILDRYQRLSRWAVPWDLTRTEPQRERGNSIPAPAILADAGSDSESGTPRDQAFHVNDGESGSWASRGIERRSWADEMSDEVDEQ